MVFSVDLFVLILRFRLLICGDLLHRCVRLVWFRKLFVCIIPAIQSLKPHNVHQCTQTQSHIQTLSSITNHKEMYVRVESCCLQLQRSRRRDFNLTFLNREISMKTSTNGQNVNIQRQQSNQSKANKTKISDSILCGHT